MPKPSANHRGSLDADFFPTSQTSTTLCRAWFACIVDLGRTSGRDRMLRRLKLTFRVAAISEIVLFQVRYAKDVVAN